MNEATAPEAQAPDASDDALAEAESSEDASPDGAGGADGAADGDAGGAGAPVEAGPTCATCGDGLALHWKFDEPNGTLAADSSGNGLQGTYTGTTGTPSPDMRVPSVGFADPWSRSFVAASAQAVKLATMPLALKPTDNVTVNRVWYRATKTTTNGSGDPERRRPIPPSLGAPVVRALRQAHVRYDLPEAHRRPVQAARRQLAPPGRCLEEVSVGMRLYFDGKANRTNTHGEKIVYTNGPDCLGRVGTETSSPVSTSTEPRRGTGSTTGRSPLRDCAIGHGGGVGRRRTPTIS